jgi:hypothetical protein
MTTASDILYFLDIHQQTPVLTSPYASRESRLRIQTDRMRLDQLPVGSIVRYVSNSAACGTPEHLLVNEQFESEGFVSYRLLLPVMRSLFSDVWPADDSSSSDHVL